MTVCIESSLTVNLLYISEAAPSLSNIMEKSSRAGTKEPESIVEIFRIWARNHCCHF